MGKLLIWFFGIVYRANFLMTKLPDFRQTVETGRNTMANSTVVICGLARDCAKNLEGMIPQVESLGSAFLSYQVLVVENDSKDGTENLVRQWSKNNRQVSAIQFSYIPQSYLNTSTDNQAKPGSAGWFGRHRITRITFARNLYLDTLDTIASPDYVIIIDLDIRSFSLAGIEYSFGLAKNWDIMTANGTRYSRRHPMVQSVYWDTYAYEPTAGLIGDTQTLDQIHAGQPAVTESLKSSHLLPARSAFGGLGIYRANLLKEARYSVQENKDQGVPVLSEHHGLHRSMIENQEGLRLFINPLQKVDYGTWLHLARHSFRSWFSGK